jgi:NADH:ubiquinone oxidoreductase subunit 6 (subunit J)
VLVALGAAITSFVVPRVAAPLSTPGVAEFGRALFTQRALPFEIASVILLIALVGAVWWAAGEDR